MNWLNQLLYRLSAYCRCRVIDGPDQQSYLERYHLMRLPFNYQIYLHRFVASDPGRGLHNHPWKRAISLLLCGQYRETRMRDARHDNQLQTRTIRAGQLNTINGEMFHRIDIDPNGECWSLFIHGPKAKGWGFLKSQVYMDHDELLQQSSNPMWWKHALRPVRNPDMRSPCRAC